MKWRAINLLFVITLTLIFLVLTPLVSSFEFDNVKVSKEVPKGEDITIGTDIVKYSSIWETYKPFEIKNAFGLGSVLTSGAITEHTEKCSNDCNSEFTIYLSEEGKLIEDIKFTGNIKEYNIYVQKGNQEISYDIFDTVCEGKLNASGTPDCVKIKTGIKTEIKVNEVNPFAV